MGMPGERSPWDGPVAGDAGGVDEPPGVEPVSRGTTVGGAGAGVTGPEVGSMSAAGVSTAATSGAATSGVGGTDGG